MSRHRTLHRCLVLVILVVLLAGLPTPVVAVVNLPPDPPVIVSPISSGVSVDDVHMEIGAPFHDPDGDRHAATDWEIWQVEDGQVVWAAYNSPQLVHAHISDGDFIEVVAARTRRLNYRTTYVFRVRFLDSRGAWSTWSDRRFTTSLHEQIALRQVQGVLTQPAPSWQSEGGTTIVLPAGARLALETVGGASLLTLAPADDGLVAAAGPRPGASEVIRLHLRAPADAAVRLPASRLTFVTDEPRRLTVYLPAVDLAPGRLQVWWVSETGATYDGTPEQSHPHTDLVARDVPLPWSVPPGYRLEAIGGAFRLPTSLAFAREAGADPAAPRFYVTELYGGITVVTNDGRALRFADDLLNFRPTPKFPGSGENGVVGVCLPPRGHDVYATMTYSVQAGGLRNKVVRIRSTDGLVATAAEDVLRIDDERSQARSSHQIQQCAFDADGKLYVSIADGPDPAAAQDDASFNGKILRLNPDGSAPADNPFFDPAHPTAPISYQYTKGHRNAFGLAWRPSDGRLYLTENGPNVDRLVRVDAGRNYGWNGTDASMRTRARYVWPEAHWSPVGLAFAEGPSAGGLPAGDRDALYVASAGPVYARGPQASGKAIQQFRLDGEGRVIGSPRLFARYVGEGRGTIIDLKLQPDGLYFTDLYQESGEGGPGAPGGRVWRLRYAGQAALRVSAASGTVPLTVDFTDTSTVEAITTWRWAFGDGAVSSERSPSHTFTRPGRYAISLTATNADGATDEALAAITVTDAAGQVPAPTPVLLAATAASAMVFFPETGMTLGGGFKHFWEAYGGLAQFGYPLTREAREVNPADGQEYTVQYFERARFEYHPEHQGTPYETQLGMLGRQMTAGREAEAPFQAVAPATRDGVLYFEATGHTLQDRFREQWETTGGVDIYGLPISEPFIETGWEGGERLVQYFERARMELNAEAASRVDEVRLARLGTERASQRRRRRRPCPSPRCGSRGSHGGGNRRRPGRR